MSDTILGGDLTIYFIDENRQKRITWTGSATGTQTINAVYSACQNLFDEPLQSDDGTPFSAETPVEYTIGIIDAGDNEPWYIDYYTMQHITGGALRTSGWTRSLPGDGTGAVGIVVVAVASGGTIVSSDVGDTITHSTDGDTGTLLDVIITGGATDYLVIRPADNTLANDFDSVTGSLTMTVSANSATQSAAAVTGEQIWANLYTIGTIEPDTHIYVYQGSVADGSRRRVYSITDQTQDWWGDGHIDRCFYIRDFTQAGFPVIDGGYLKVYARKYTTLFDNFEVSTSLTSGGRNPIPLATSPDLDNKTGYASVTTATVTTDDFAVGDEIQGQTSGARGIITAITGTSPTYTIHYYLVDDPLTDFQASEQILNVDGTGDATLDANAPVAQGPASPSWFTSGIAPSATFTAASFDIDDDGVAEGYGITLNCNNNPLNEVYEWVKYICRRGEVSTVNSDGIEGEQYVGAEVYLEYSGAVTGTIAEGDDVTQANTGATGIVISHDATLGQILLRDTRGVFNTTDVVTSNDSGGTVVPDVAASVFAPKKSSPLGTFAGGTFFGARGVLLSNWVSADENNFQLTDSQGNIRKRPVAISLTITNLVGGTEAANDSDTVAAFRLTGSGGTINKTEYSCVGGEAVGASTIAVSTPITADTPGKTTGGVLNIRDVSNSNKQWRIRFDSWTGSTFTLSTISGTAGAGTTSTTVVITGAFANAKRGDLVYNSTVGAFSYVTTVDSADQITISPAITGQAANDAISLNVVPVALAAGDDLYVPLIDRYATGTQESVSIVYQAPVYYRVVVRNQRNATKIKPFTTDDVTTGDNRSVATIRTTDTIASP